MNLNNKTIFELRSIAEGYGIPDVFSRTAPQLIADIQRRQTKEEIAPDFAPPSQNQYDTRLMTKRPARDTGKEYALEILKGYIDKGLQVTFPDPDKWHMYFKGKEDTGTLRMPPRTILKCAKGVMRK